jgi:hypothetical protein
MQRETLHPWWREPVLDPVLDAIEPRAGVGVRPREGEIAFAVSVATLYDLTLGRIGWGVRLTQHSHDEEYTLTLANRTPGGPILNILATNPDGTLNTADPVFQVWNSGVSAQKVGGYLDLRYQEPGTPENPGPGSNTLRMYSRDGQLYFRVEDSTVEQQIPIGDPPGPSVRWAHWMGGG